jgi:hypothetical protein
MRLVGLGVVEGKKRRENGMRSDEMAMTKALEDAFKEAQELPEREQDQLAEAIRAEIQAERNWAKLLVASGGALADLADEALAEHQIRSYPPARP